MTTATAFRTSMNGLSITGIKRDFGYEPASIGAADLPAKFTRNPDGDFSDAPANCLEVGKTRSLDIVVCISPVGLETVAQNQEDLDTYTDRMEAALDAWNIAPAQNGVIVEYSTQSSQSDGIQVGDAFYWGIIATVTITG